MFKKIADLLGGGLLKGATGLIDELITSKEEKGQLNLKMQELLNKVALQAQQLALESERELSRRHENDMNSDSWLSKNIRPLTLIVIIVLYSVFAITDGNIGGEDGFNISDAYVSLLGQWGMLIMSFYFGGRTVEKTTSIIGTLFKKKGSKKNK